MWQKTLKLVKGCKKEKNTRWTNKVFGRSPACAAPAVLQNCGGARGGAVTCWGHKQRQGWSMSACNPSHQHVNLTASATDNTKQVVILCVTTWWQYVIVPVNFFTFR